MPEDERFMHQALDLAEASVGLASPNPQVGCVIVQDGTVVGTGAHVFDRFDHAEIVALKKAGVAADGATAYITLEPCSHHGRTGPCADALIAAGIARCVVATGDPNPSVGGQGIRRLQAAGIAVEVGLLETRARRLNDSFALSILRHRPFVTLKAALSADGKLAPPAARRPAGAPFWLTGAEARADVQRLRHGSDAILTGIGTVLADDPLLTDRTGRHRRRPLMRVVLDTHLRTPTSSKLVQTAREKRQDDLWIFCGPKASAERRTALEAAGIKVTAVGGQKGLDLVDVLEHLYSVRLLSVLVEAGSAVNGAFLRKELVDRAVLFFSATELGADAIEFAEGSAGPFALEERLIHVTRQTMGGDVRVSGLLHDPWASAPRFS